MDDMFVKNAMSGTESDAGLVHSSSNWVELAESPESAWIRTASWFSRLSSVREHPTFLHFDTPSLGTSWDQFMPDWNEWHGRSLSPS